MNKVELWSKKERRAYYIANATVTIIDRIPILTTPKGEPLLTRIK